MHGFEDGGAQRRVLTLAQQLAAQGLRVDLLVAWPQGPLRERLDDRVQLHVLPMTSLLAVLARRPRAKPWLRVQAVVPALAEWLRREKPEVFVAAANHAVLPAIRAWRRAGHPEIALALRVSNAIIGHRQRLGDPLKRRIWKRSLPQAHAVATVATALEQEILALAPALSGHVRTISNPVIAALPPLQREPDSRPLLLGVGRLVEQKDFATLIEAFAILRREREARLVILGEGPQRALLQRRIDGLGLGDDVQLAGFADDPLPWYRRARLMVLSSRWEGMPGVLIEAMAAGCPVASTDCAGGSRELLRNGELGPLSPVGDAPALAASMAAALDHPVAAEQLRQRAADFTFESATRDFLGVLQYARTQARAD